MGEALPDDNFWKQFLPRSSKARLHLEPQTTYLLDFRQIIGYICTECLDAHTVPIVAPFPNLRKVHGCEWDVPLPGDIFGECVGAWKNDF